MKEVPQKTAYVVIDPAWGEPQIILETVSTSEEEARRKVLVHPNYALWSGAALHITPPVPGDWDRLEAQGFMVQEMVCGIVPDSIPVFDPSILTKLKSEAEITQILQENAAIMGQPVREVITQLRYERDRNQASRQYHISKVRQLNDENEKLRRLDEEYGRVETAIIMADSEFDGDSAHANCGDRLVDSVKRIAASRCTCSNSGVPESKENHVCALNRAMNGECMVCGSVDQVMADLQREADSRHATLTDDSPLAEAVTTELSGHNPASAVNVPEER